jgi:hypothetical protein
LRDKDDYASLGGPYYADEFGNLLRLGSFNVQRYAGAADFAITYLRAGGVQLVLDFRRDSVVDVVFDLTPEGRIGFIADSQLLELIDCFVGLTSGGLDPVKALESCLGRADSAGGKDGGMTLLPAGAHDRLAAPECGPAGEPDRGVVAQPPGGGGENWTEVGRFGPHDDGPTRSTVVFETRPNAAPGLGPDARITITSSNRDTGRIAITQTVIDYNETGTRTTVTRDRSTPLPNGRVAYERERTVDGRRQGRTLTWVVDPATGECTGDCREAGQTSPSSSSSDGADGGTENPDAGGSSAAPADGGDTGQPSPTCELDGTCPVSDPRCSAPRNDAESLWDCVARTGLSPLECLARIQDAIFAVTGCENTPGPADQPLRKCLRSPARSFAECLERGGAVEECLRRAAVDAGGSELAPSEFDDLTSEFRNAGASDIEYVETTPVGAVLFALCQRGMEQFCRNNPGRF